MFRRYSYWKSSHLTLIDSHKLGTHTGTHIRFLSDGKLHPRVLRPFPRLWGGKGRGVSGRGRGRGRKSGDEGHTKSEGRGKNEGCWIKINTFSFHIFQATTPTSWKTHIYALQPSQMLNRLRFTAPIWWSSKKISRKLKLSVGEGWKRKLKWRPILILLLFAKEHFYISGLMKDPQLLMEKIFCSNNFSEDYQGGDDMGGGEFDSGKFSFDILLSAKWRAMLKIKILTMYHTIILWKM